MLRNCLASTVLALLVATPAFSAEVKKKAPDVSEQVLYQALSITENETLPISAGGGGMVVSNHNYSIAAKAVSNGKPKTIVYVTGKDSSIAKQITAIKPGSYFAADTTHKGSNAYDFGTTFKPYTQQPGEDRPNVFLFADSSTVKQGSQERTVVKLYKLGMIVPVVVPMAKDSSGKNASDAAILQSIEKLSKGDVVEVSVAAGSPPTIKSIEPYAAPQSAIFTKTTQSEFNGTNIPSIEVTIDGTASTLLLATKNAAAAWAADATLAKAAARFKSGDKVVVRFLESDGQKILKEIAADK